MMRRREAGQALVLVAVAMVVLIGIAGLGVDMGVVRYEKRIQQSAADAAAIAGANNLASSSGGVIVGGRNASAANGFTDNAGGALSSCTASGATVGTVCVQVSDPVSGPITGPHKNDRNYVEAYVSEVHDTYFMKIFGVTKQVVTARAVATNLSGTNSGCLYTLGPKSGITGHGGGKKGGIIAPTCGIVDNGPFDLTGGFPVCAGSISVAGTGSGVGSQGACTANNPGSGAHCNNQSVSTCPAPIPAAGNPLANLTVGTQPPHPSCSGNCFNPGTYNSGDDITMKGNGTYTFNPGIYVLNGANVVCHGTPSITGVGVMFYLENGSTWTCSGNSSVTLTAPTASNCPACPSQDYGILIYQNPVNDQNSDTLSGGGNSTPDEGFNGLVVIWGLTVNGNDEVTLGGTAGFGMTALKNAILVE